MTDYLPEGLRENTTDWNALLENEETVQRAIREKRIFEAIAQSCDREHNLWFSLGDHTGFMPRNDCALGIETGQVREIAVISRVNKPVCFRILSWRTDERGRIEPILSRTDVQKEAKAWLLSAHRPGDVIDVVVRHLEPFGAFVDIGCGISSLIATANLSVSRIDHPGARVRVGQAIKCVIREIDPNTGRFTLSQKELLGTWEENAAQFDIGCTVTGIVRSVENYGVFIELTPNLSGLAEYSGPIDVNTRCAVFIKNIIPERMKIKLSVISTDPKPAPPTPLKYYITSGCLRRWVYSPSGCGKVIETVF